MQATKLKIGFWALLLVLFGGLYANAEDAEWMHWQKRYHDLRAQLNSDPEQIREEKERPFEVKYQDVTATLQGSFGRSVSAFRGYQRETCITCHDGISEVSASHPATFGCTVCHGGNGDALDKSQAHGSLIFDPESGTGKRNPSALSVVHLSCGQNGCHSGHQDATQNHVERVKRSMMGTTAGMIAGLRFQWGAQSQKEARYGAHPVPPSNQIRTRAGAVDHLQPLPVFTEQHRGQKDEASATTTPVRISQHIADSLLKTTCLQCHLDAKPPAGEFRSQGCAACHFRYSAEGTYQGLDPTIDSTEPGHPGQHRMTALPDQNTCLQCHKSMQGAGPSDSEDATGKNSQTGSPSLILKSGTPHQDVHFQKGMECIDCHTGSDIMGDGQIYSRQYQAVEIRCTTCHGTGKSHPSIAKIESSDDPAVRVSKHYQEMENKPGDWLAVSSRNNKVSNVKVEKGKLVTISKTGGNRFDIPLIKGTEAHSIPEHSNKLACSACHSSWVPECSGCHSIFNDTRASSDSPTGKTNPWSSLDFQIQHKEPALMVGPRGKVTPMLSQPSRTLTALDSRGNPLVALNVEGDAIQPYKNFRFTNPLGYSGANLAYSTQPHSTSKQVRSCESCHLSPQALGLGTGDMIVGRDPSGKRDRVVPLLRKTPSENTSATEVESKVTLRGQPIAGTHQPGARPFNQKEISRILKVGNCLPCHSKYGDPIYQNMQKSYRYSKTMDHRRLRDRILKAAE